MDKRRLVTGGMILWGIVGSFLFDARAEAMSLTGSALDVRQAILSTARLGKFNVVLDDEITGTISLNLKDMAPVDILSAIAAVKNLTVEERAPGLFIVVAAKGNMLRQARSFPIKYANPAHILAVVRETLGINGDTSRSGAALGKNDEAASKIVATSVNDPRIAIDAATNTLVLYGTPTEAGTVERILRQIDIPARQISLEAKVMALDKSATKDLGVEWSWSSLPQYPKRETDYETHSRVIEDADGTRHTVTYEVPRTTVTRSYGNGAIPGIIQFGKGPEGYPFEFYYEAKLNALITDGKAKMISHPNIVTLNGQEAIINIGGEIPVPKTVATNTTATSSVEYKKVGIILRCTPRVNDDGFITSDVHTEVSSPVYVPEMRAYRVENRAADTTVRLKDGETMVIGGLIGSEEAKSFTKVPFLGDIPLFGALFRNEKRSKSDSEIMIFLTAHTAEGGRQDGGNGSDRR